MNQTFKIVFLATAPEFTLGEESQFSNIWIMIVSSLSSDFLEPWS
jgi:hypothetical protein